MRRAAAQHATAPPRLALVDLGLPPTPHRPDEGFALIARPAGARARRCSIVVLVGPERRSQRPPRARAGRRRVHRQAVPSRSSLQADPATRLLRLDRRRRRRRRRAERLRPASARACRCRSCAPRSGQYAESPVSRC
ncbi:MAG: hypothetical protein MZW92_18175 [Comamonadaceae bacterium]|nr:hypothetical protein [Comamonadaceae bacterium]